MTILKELFRFGTLYFSVKLLLLPNFPPTFPFINHCYYNQTYHFWKIVIMLNVPPDPKLTEKSHLNSAQFIYYISSEPDFTSRRPVRKQNCKFPWNRRTLNLLRMERRYLQLLLLLLYFCPNLYLYCWCIKRRLWYKML